MVPKGFKEGQMVAVVQNFCDERAGSSVELSCFYCCCAVGMGVLGLD